ncbi:MAG: hypothetical protein M0024_11060 [Nitrospiraceae bacterium]|nr:hypothetical protein [Nitrospiraceae bacterium]
MTSSSSSAASSPCWRCSTSGFAWVFLRLKDLTEPYFTTKDPAKGTGLGLYMSKVIIEDHMGGRLAASGGEEGAVFTIELAQAAAEG